MIDTPDLHCDVLIVGSGHAGAQLAIALRQLQFSGSIGLLGDESAPPYERPPLSKEYLAGEKPFDRLLLRPPIFWPERGIRLLPGHTATTVDPVAHALSLSDGQRITYGKLAWAAGGQPRRLTCAGKDLSGIHYVRSKADVDLLIAELPSVSRVVVVGAGYIGLEVAAVLTKLGKSVTILEAQERVLARVAGKEISQFYEAEHAAHGVRIHTAATIDRLEGRDGAVTGVRLADSSVIAGEMVIVGIGVVPAVGPLVSAGALGDNGVFVDEFCRTSLPDVYALGDCAAHENAFASGRRIRLESVQNANDQASTVAAAIVGIDKPSTAIPWFWSNQYDLKLQTVGLSAGYDTTVTRGTPEARSFSVIYLGNGRVLSLDCVNATKDYVQGRSLVAARAVVAENLLRDPTIPLKNLVNAP